MKKSRQLAAIMFTDIEGYTALMQRDEAKAVSIREKHRSVFNATTGKHHGRILQYFGDGTLSIFDSAIDAVECAIEMQQSFRSDPPVDVRIGIHLGDVIYNEDEIIGDGVNVASRVESMALSGSILVSDKVFDEIKNQETIQTVFMKSVKFKNVDRSMNIYAVANEGVLVPNAEELKGKTEPDPVVLRNLKRRKKRKRQRIGSYVTIALAIVVLMLAYISRSDPTNSAERKAKPKNSIAVLAFENMSGDPDKEYFSDGISEEILNSLVQVQGLKVAGRTSAFSFKDSKEDIQTIGDALNVEMVLEGSIRKSKDRIRITAQLIKVEDGFHMWSETYDRDLKDVFKIQEEIAHEIAQRLKLELGQPQKVENNRNMEAYDLLLKGIYFFNKDYEGAEKALQYFKQAIAQDPQYAEAYAWLGDTYINHAIYGFLPNADAYALARSAARESIRLNAKEPKAHRVLAYIHLNYDWDWEGALREYELATQYGLQTPDHFITLYDIFINQDYEASIEASKEILRRDPFHIQSHWHVGLSYYFSRDFEKAIEAFNHALELDTNYSEGHRWKALALAELERYDEAIEAINTALEITNNQGPANLDKRMIQLHMGEKDVIMAVLHQWETSDDYVDPIAPAMLYAQLNQPEEALRWLEKAYRERSFQLVSLKFYWVWNPIREHQRFQEIYDALNFDLTL